MTSRNRSLRTLLRGAGGVAVALAVMNVTTYGFNFLAVYLLGPREYGVTASLMGVIGVANVLSLGLQATGARHVAARPEQRTVIEAAVMRTTWRSAAGVALLCLLLTPVFVHTLNLNGWHAAATVGLTMFPLTLMGGQAGILQGEQRWFALGMMYLAVGVPRFALAALAMWIWPTAFASMAAVAIAAWAPALIGALALGHIGPRRTSSGPRSRVIEEGVRILREIGHNSHALFLFFALSTVDLLVARAVMDDHSAGLYAGGAIITKAVLFLPQFVVVVAFPSMAKSAGHRVYLLGLTLVGSMGAVAIAAAALFPDLALVFAGGRQFREIIGLIPWFAVLGTVLAMLQLMVYQVVSRQFTAALVALWAGLGAIVLLGSRAESPAQLVRIASLVDLTTLVVIVALVAWHSSRDGVSEPRRASSDPSRR